MSQTEAFVLSLATPDLVGLRAVLTSSGAFYLADHGVDAKALDATYAAMAALCALPPERRAAVQAGELPEMRGFSDLSLDAEYRQSWFCTVGLPEGEAAWPIPGAQPWPADVPALQAAIAAVAPSLQLATERALALALRALGAPEATTQDLLRAPGGVAIRLLRYPALPDGVDRPGVTPHSDRPPLTIITQNDVDGLQWAKRDAAGRPEAWFDLPGRPGCLLVQVGDALAHWSNDVARANIHRVDNRSDRDRYSLACFALPHPDTELQPWPSCGEPIEPTVTFGRYLRDWLDSLRGEHIYQPPTRSR